MICNLTNLGKSVILTLADLRSKLRSDLSKSQSICVDPPWREKDENQRSILNNEEVIDKKLDEIDVPENGTFFVWSDLEGQRLT